MNVLLCPLSDGGYLYPAIAVGRELRGRGHHVSVLARAGAAPIAAEAGLPFAAAEEFGGRRAFSATWWGRTGVAQYRATVRAARQARADLLVTSVLCNGALLAAETLDIPVVVIGLAAHLWDYRSGGAGEQSWGRTRENRTAVSLDLYESVREQAGLPPRRTRRPDDPARGHPCPGSPLLGEALLLRGDPELEHPGSELPQRVHHVGPLAWEPAADAAETAAIRAHTARRGKPVVYVHLGRFFGGRDPWPQLNEAFTGGPLQAVVEQGRSTDPRPAAGADILLVRKPWMGPLVDMAELVLTSGTSAPVLGALLRGRPLAVSPNGSEQPLLSWACLRAGVAVHLPKAPDPSQDVRSAAAGPAALLTSALRDEQLRDRAAALGRRLAAAGGPARAADVIDQVVQQSATSRENHEYAISRPASRGRGAGLDGRAAVDTAALGIS
ncbi:glycosyltransferase [Streptomyces sp. NPDC020917]|uniref:glycosyltransferase n=1 Tax=Streptomyces sp. NPDC020917 TaxID=3365102 RepID=UPI00378D84A8